MGKELREWFARSWMSQEAQFTKFLTHKSTHFNDSQNLLRAQTAIFTYTILKDSQSLKMLQNMLGRLLEVQQKGVLIILQISGLRRKKAICGNTNLLAIQKRR